ncbi:MAG: hypothetical protein QOJ22_997 [Thermoleophilaceae bacterium]|jgi:hypothetical protein|nr:hypothetical protein [Thermoleophilaceae bacterium]
MTQSARIPALFAVVAACLGVSACGGDDTGDPIPAGKATQLEQHLDALEQSVQEGCVSVAAELRDAQAIVSSLDGDGVGEDVQDALANGIDNLRTVAARECRARLQEEETVPETTIDPIPDTTETTEPPETETVPPAETETIPPAPPDDDDEEESDEGDGGAQFEPDSDIPPGQEKKDRKRKGHE